MSWVYNWTDGHPGWTQYGPEQSENAQAIAERLESYRDVTIERNAAIGIIANMTHESWLNPGQWELGSNYSPSAGFGLGQWTPSTKYSNWLGSTAVSDMADGDNQIDYLLDSPGQWSTTYVDMNTGWSSYYSVHVPILATMTDYLTSTATIQDLTTAWMVYWERPAAATAGLAQRIAHAEYWDEHIDYHGGGNVPIWLICKAAQNWRM